MKLRVPTSLQVTVPLLLLAFAAVLGTVHLLHEVPRAESAAEDDVRKRLAEELTRLQSTAGYFMIKGDIAGAQHEIAVLARNQDVALALLTDDDGIVIASTRRAWLGQSAANLLPLHDLHKAEAAIHERRAGVVMDASGNQMLGYAGIPLGGNTAEPPPNRIGCPFIAYDLTGHKAEARAHLLQQ